MPLPFLWPGPPLPLFYQWDLFKTPSPLMKRRFHVVGYVTILPDHVYHIYWNTKILQNDPSRGYGRRLLKFWSYSTFGDQWTNGLSAPPMTCVSSPTKKTNPLLPDLQLTAQPQLVSRVCLKCNFHIMPIIRWQLPAAFLLSPPHLLSPLFFKMPTSRCELSDSCTICKVELPRRYLQICNIQTLRQDPGQNLRKQNSKQAQMGILKKEGGLNSLKCPNFNYVIV